MAYKSNQVASQKVFEQILPEIDLKLNSGKGRSCSPGLACVVTVTWLAYRQWYFVSTLLGALLAGSIQCCSCYSMANLMEPHIRLYSNVYTNGALVFAA